jgi:hypothetical protein
MQIAFVLYDQFTALDIVGLFQTLADLPGGGVGARRMLPGSDPGPPGGSRLLRRRHSTR